MPEVTKLFHRHGDAKMPANLGSEMNPLVRTVGESSMGHWMANMWCGLSRHAAKVAGTSHNGHGFCGVSIEPNRRPSQNRATSIGPNMKNASRFTHRAPSTGMRKRNLLVARQ